MKIGFIGTGAITEAIVTGLLASDFDVSEVIVSERNRAVSTRLAALDDKVRVCSENQEIVDLSDLVVLAVRPQIAEQVLSPLRFADGQRVCSLIATFEAETLEGWIGTPVEIFRAIPLPSVATRVGFTALYPQDPLGEDIFSRLGTVVAARTLDEFDTFAVSSSLMGTYFGFLETAADWMHGRGIDRGAAKSYLDGVFLGLAQTSSAAGDTPFADLRVEHSTPGGLNEQMFREFAASGGAEAILTALDSVARRVKAARRDPD